MNDLITADKGTLDDGDTIIDSSSTDSDIMNITLARDDAAPTIHGIETINVNLDVFAGAGATLAATKIKGATINLSSDKLGFDGVAEVTDAGANNVTAGDNITSLSVQGLSTGTVDTGSATTATIASTNKATDMNVTVNGDITTTLTGGNKVKTVNLTNTADSKVTIDAPAASLETVTVAGANDMTLVTADELNGLTVTNNLTAGELAVSVTDNIADASKWDVNKIVIADDAANLLKLADNANVEITTVGTDTTLSSEDATNTVNISTAVNTGDIIFTTDEVGTANITVSGKRTIDLITSGNADVNIAIDADTVIKDLNVADDKVVVTGTGNLEVTSGDKGTLDASGVTGKLTFTADTEGTYDIKGGTGKNTVITQNAGDVLTYTGQAEVDTVTGTGVQTGTISAETGAGDDVITAAALTTGILAVNTGTGDDTVTLETTLTSGTVTADLGAGDDEFTIGDITNNLDASAAVIAIESGAGDDKLTLGDVTVSTNDGETAKTTITLDGGAGDDTFTIGSLTETEAGTSTATIIATIDGGTGDDTLHLKDTADLTDGDVTIKNVENIVLDGTTATVSAESITGQEINISAKNAADDSIISIDLMTATTSSIDLSGLDIETTLAATDLTGTEIDLSNGDLSVTLVATSANDEITLSGNGDTITAGKGADSITADTEANTFVYAQGDSTSTAYDDISSYDDGNTIDYTKDMVAGTATADAAAGTAKIVEGLATFHTDDDTLVEQFAAISSALGTSAEGTMAFFYDGSASSYVYISDGVAGVSDNDVVIELTGVNATATTITDGNATFTIA